MAVFGTPLDEILRVKPPAALLLLILFFFFIVIVVVSHTFSLPLFFFVLEVEQAVGVVSRGLGVFGVLWYREGEGKGRSRGHPHHRRRDRDGPMFFSPAPQRLRPLDMGQRRWTRPLHR